MTQDHPPYTNPSDTLAFGGPSDEPGDGSEPRRRGVKGALVTGAVAATVGSLALGGLAVAQFLSGGGPQPEEALPDSTIAFVKVDLDPSAGQKVNALRLARKFPQVANGTDDLKQALLEDAFDENPYGLTYQDDLAPWVGNRAAVGAVSTPGTKDKAAPVVAVEFTDQDAMVRALEKARTRIAAEDGDDDFAYAIREPYVLISEKQAEVDAMAAAPTLAADPEVADVLEAADDQIMFAWGDIAALAGLAPTDELRGAFGSEEATGHFTLGVHAEADYVEATASVVGYQPELMPDDVPAGTDLLDAMPHDSFAAVAVNGMGAHAKRTYATMVESMGTPREIRASESQLEAQYGIRLPEDLGMLLGTEAALAVTSPDADSFEGAARVRTDDGDRAVSLLSPMLEMSGEPDLRISATPDGYVVGTSGILDVVRAGTGGLTSTESFKRAVAAPDTAGAVLYVDLGTVIDSWAPPETAKELAPLEALGMSGTADQQGGTYTLRLTFD